MTLPTVLLIDDLCARSPLELQDLCDGYGLVPASTKELPASFMLPEDPVAMVEVISGQTLVRQNTLRNDDEATVAEVARGWPDPSVAAERPPWALVLLDINFISGKVDPRTGEPDGNVGDSEYGFLILDRIHARFPGLPVAMISGEDRDSLMDRAIAAGAVEYLTRAPSKHPSVQRAGDAAEEGGRRLLRQILHDHGMVEEPSGLLVGRSTPFLRSLADARRAATGTTTLLLGETGTGKELFAYYIHQHSHREDTPFLAHDLSSPETMLESLLFGVAPKVATGVSGRPGLFELAADGALFLDEIGELGPELQAKMLRVLEQRSVARVGEEGRQIPVRAHIICATNRDLRDEVSANRFRSDLYFRIEGFQVRLPALRERLGDVPLLASHFLKTLTASLDVASRHLAPEATAALMAHSWPGNVRELRNVIERALRAYPHAEVLVPAHLALSSVTVGSSRGPVTTGSSGPPSEGLRTAPPASGHSAGSMLDALARAESLPVSALRSSLHGRLDQLLGEHLRDVCRFMEISLNLTLREKGMVNLAGAAKFMTGRTSMTTVQAADLLLGCLRAQGDEALQEVLKEFPLTSTAWNKACRLRRRPPRQSTGAVPEEERSTGSSRR